MYPLIKELKKDSTPSKYRCWYNKWVKENAIGKVLDVGKSQFWDYGFPTIDTNPTLKPTYVGNIEKTAFPDEMFDTVLCNGMYEYVKNPQKMINEVLRITKEGGNIIFGFVGKNYKPYKEDRKYYDGGLFLPRFHHIRETFNKEYYFITCQKY